MFYLNGNMSHRRSLNQYSPSHSQALTSSEEKYPIFTFVEGRAEMEREYTSDSITHIKTKEKMSRKQKKSSTEEFVLL